MPGAMQSKGDGEWPYSAPFTGLNVSVPSILLPPQAQDIQTSPNFSICRGSIAAPWPYATTLFGSSLGSGEYLLFATASGLIITNLAIYQIQGGSNDAPENAFQLVQLATMPSGAFPSTGSNVPVPFIETNGCLYFSCQLGIYRFAPGPVNTFQVGRVSTGSLTPGTYYILVTAIVNGTETPPSNEIAVEILSPDHTIVLSWNAVYGASSYNVYVGTTPGGENEVFSTSLNNYSITSYTAGAATPPASLTAWWAGFGANFLTIFSERMLVVGTVATPADLVPSDLVGTPVSGGSLPAATYYAVVTPVFASGAEGWPSIEASATSDGSESISWTWTAVPGAVSYNIYVGTATGEENAVYTSSTNSYSLTAYTTGTVSPPSTTPISPYTVAWSAVSTFDSTSYGIFNSNPNTDAGVVGGYDVLTNYAQGIPTGIINLGYSLFIVMTQGMVNINPSTSVTDSPYSFYNYWQETVPCGGLPGSVAQYGPISVFVTPDNVMSWTPGTQTPIGTPIMPYIRKLLLNASLNEIPNGTFPLLQNPPMNATFLTIYGELHYVLTFNVMGVPPQQATPPYPNQATETTQFGLILDYNFATQSWAQQVTPPLTGEIYQIIGPPLTTTTYAAIPQQNLLIVGTISGTTPGWLIFATDVFNQNAWSGAQCEGLSATPQQCQVGFPQTPVAAGHRPAVRRVRIEYSFDDMSCATQTAPIDLTVTVQGTITQNTGTTGGDGVATTQIVSIAKTIQIQPPGVTATGSGTITPYLTSTAYADMVLSCENPQVSLSWTDPSAHQRLLVHRVTLMVNDTQGVLQ